MATTTNTTTTPKQNGKLSPENNNSKIPSPPSSSVPASFRPYEITPKDESRKNSGGGSTIKSSVPKKTSPKSPEGSSDTTKSVENHVTTAHHSSSSSDRRKRTSGSSENVSSSSVKKSRQDSGGKVSPKQDKEKDQGASPIIRSGLEVLQGNDYRKQMTPFSSFYPPPPPHHVAQFENNHPAFRPLFPGGSHLLPPQHHFPPTGSPYIGYSRVKSASGGESIVPVCKDPYCGGCQFSGAGGGAGSSSSSSSSAVALMAAAAGFSFPGVPTSTAGVGLSCPIGCVQACDHPKIPYSTAGGMPMPASFFPSLLPPYPPPPSVQTSQSSPPGGSASRPYVCNWIVGESYCGKRFGSSEELLQHLRTHPSTAGPSVENSSSSAALAAAMMQQQQAAAYSSLLAGLGGHHRTYPTPPLSPLDSAGRYNPYAAAAAMAKAMGHHHPGGLFPPGGPLGPPPPASLAGLYSASPYAALYGQKIPQVHP